MGKRKRDFADTYVFDDDVLDEMEGFQSTSVFDDAEILDNRLVPDDDELLDDIETSTVVLDNSPPGGKRR
jgi:hypothetical protein